MPPATRSAGNSSRMIPNASGKMAPPSPWIKRAPIITGSVVASAATNVPPQTPARTTTRVRFLPNMSPRRPAIGVATDAASRYAVKIHVTPEGVVSRSFCRVGSAGTTSDWSKAYAPPPTARTASTTPGRTPLGVELSTVGAAVWVTAETYASRSGPRRAWCEPTRVAHLHRGRTRAARARLSA